MASRTSSGKHNEKVQLYAFDVLAMDGDNLRALPLSMRKANLERLLALRSRAPDVGDVDLGLHRDRVHGFAITSMTFNPGTCLGTVTLSGGEVYVYSSSNSGNTITFTYYTNDNVLAVFNIVLQRE
jgi:hypothetical protein